MSEDQSLKKVYRVGSADWNTEVSSYSEQEAASIGLQNVLNKTGKKTNLSFLIEVEENIYGSELHLFKTSSVLADIGFFKLAEEFSRMSDFFLDKGKNPH